jgi:hypothetical protein
MGKYEPVWYKRMLSLGSMHKIDVLNLKYIRNCPKELNMTGGNN